MYVPEDFFLLTVGIVGMMEILTI